MHKPHFELEILFNYLASSEKDFFLQRIASVYLPFKKFARLCDQHKQGNTNASSLIFAVLDEADEGDTQLARSIIFKNLSLKGTEPWALKNILTSNLDE